MKHALATLLLTVMIAAPVDATPPASHQFIVVAAPREPTVTNMQAAYRPNDPQLVNRLVVISPSAASFGSGMAECARVTRTTERVAAGKLFRHIFPDHASYGKTYVAKPVDFGLKLAPTAIIATTRFRCAQPRNDGERWNDARLFPLGDGRWALSLIQDHLLILRPASGPIQASFDCRKARSTAEQAICGDRMLAGWDRSVADAYASGAGTVEEQRSWLAEREKCMANKACLQNSMANRTINLLH